MRSARNAVFAFVLLTLSTLATEVVLQVGAALSPKIAALLASPWVPLILKDPRLGHRPNPLHPEHDERGFRNPEVPSRADVVALGDSQTYGTGVAPEQAWPRQLESASGKKVYGIAFGGYGPAHSLLLWDEALSLEPAVVIEAFYLGNDLFDAFDVVYTQGQLPELRSADPGRQAKITAAEDGAPLREEIDALLHAGAKHDDPLAPEPDPADATLLRRIAEGSKLYGLLRRIRFELGRIAAARDADPEADWATASAFALAHPEYCQSFDDGRFRTVFMSEYRLKALDLEDDRIDEGLDIALAAIDDMASRARARGIRFLVLLIPTKETVFAPLWKTPSQSFESLIANEARVTDLARRHLAERGIELLEAAPALRATFERGEQPYPASQDGHPNAIGHRAIAELVAGQLARP